MTTDEFSVNDINYHLFEERNFYYWQYGIESSFDLINLSNDKDREQALDALIQENASKYGVVLY